MPKSLQAQRYRQLPSLLREMRQKASMTQRELGRKLGINHTLIHNSETAERRVDVAEFVDWAVACGLDPAEALTEFLRRRRS
jgi:transcriptional regulator with XRE-family HTH domain